MSHLHSGAAMQCGDAIKGNFVLIPRMKRWILSRFGRPRINFKTAGTLDHTVPQSPLTRPSEGIEGNAHSVGLYRAAAFYLSGVAGAQHLRLVTGISKFGD